MHFKHKDTWLFSGKSNLNIIKLIMYILEYISSNATKQ